MFYLKLIRYYFVFLTLLVILSPVTYGFWDFFPSIVFIWGIYFIFSKSKNKVSKTTKKINPVFSNKDITLVNNKQKIRLITISALIFFPLYAKFYTGNNLLDSLILFFSGNAFGTESTYYLYQNHFTENELGRLTLKKLPFIIGNGVFKLVFWIFVIKVIGYTRRITYTEIFSLTIFFLLYFLVGIARGTSFENFELLFILVFSLLLRFQIFYSSSWIKGKTKILIYSLIGLGVFYFILSKAMRYGGDISYIPSSGTSLEFKHDHFIATNFPFLTVVIMSLAGYFLFGMYAISNALNATLLNGTLKGILASFLPFGLQITNYGESYRSFLCGEIIICGASWIPDSLISMDYTGLPLLLFLIFLIGNIAYSAYSKAKQGSIWHAILLFLIVYLMFSFPVGNFITTSSANIIAIFLFVLLHNKRLQKHIIIQKTNTINNEESSCLQS